MNSHSDRGSAPETARFGEDLGPRPPLKIVRDRFGRLWLCRADADEQKDLASQGCWRCGDLTFTSRT